MDQRSVEFEACPQLDILCQTPISKMKRALSSTMTIPVVPPLSASVTVRYYDANCHLERWLIRR
jgi:hypothetical protein